MFCNNSKLLTSKFLQVSFWFSCFRILSMAILQPSNYISGFDLLAATTPAPSQGIFIPLAALPNLTAVEVDPSNGDIRKLMYELNRIVFNCLSNFDTTDKPTKFTITRATPIGVNATTIRQSYTTSFDLAIDDVDVAFEPSNQVSG